MPLHVSLRRAMWGLWIGRSPHCPWLAAAACHRAGKPIRRGRFASWSAFRPAARTTFFARIIAQWLSEQLGQPFVIENHPASPATSPPRGGARAGRTAPRCCCRAGQRHLRSLYAKLELRLPARHRAGRRRTRVPRVLVVNPSLPVKTVPELIAHAKANPGKINIASPGTGTPHSPASCSRDDRAPPTSCNTAAPPALKAIIAGDAQVMFETLSASIEQMRGGKLRALGVTTASAPRRCPDVPPRAKRCRATRQ